MLKVGDKVKVREDIKACGKYGVLIANSTMVNEKGKIATITFIDCDESYRIDLDNGRYWWSEEMFEIIEKEVSVNMKIKEMTLNEILDSIFEGKLEMEEFNKQFETFCYEKVMEMLTK